MLAHYALSAIVSALYALIVPDAPLGGPLFHVRDACFVAVFIVACVIAPLLETCVPVGNHRRIAVLSALSRGLGDRRCPRSPSRWRTRVTARSTRCAPQRAVVVLATVFVVEQEKRGAPF